MINMLKKILEVACVNSNLLVVSSFSDIDDCVNVTCQNGGSCIDGINNFTCSCQMGYTGVWCETGNEYSYHFKENHYNSAIIIRNNNKENHYNSA